jgi:hypothetical protein
MSALWEFLLSSLQDTLGKDLGRLVAVIFCLLLVLAFGAPLFLVMRSTTNLRSRRDDLLAQDSGGESLNPVILPRSDANPDTSLHASAQPVILPQSGGPELQSRNDLNLRNVERGGLATYRYIVIAIIGITVACVFLSRRANPGNALAVVPFMLFVLAVALVGHMGKFRQLMKSGPSIDIGKKVIRHESIVIRLDNDAIQKVRDSLSAGQDLDAVCREIEPAYANWGYIQQEIFRKALDMMLKSQKPASNPSQITVR